MYLVHNHKSVVWTVLKNNIYILHSRNKCNKNLCSYDIEQYWCEFCLQITLLIQYSMKTQSNADCCEEQFKCIVPNTDLQKIQ